MTRTLSNREKWLAIVVATVLILFAAFFLIERLQQEGTRLRAEIATRTKQLHMMQNLAGELADSEQREAWLQAAQPKLTNPDSAGVQLLNEVKEVARRHGVLLENPAIRPVERHSEYASVAVEVESKSPWKPLIAFQYDLQNPAQFIAVESANLKIDAADPTKLRGRFRISRWFAPH
jgi:Tfp pilus assembly protein PilO